MSKALSCFYENNIYSNICFRFDKIRSLKQKQKHIQEVHVLDLIRVVVKLFRSIHKRMRKTQQR